MGSLFFLGYPWGLILQALAIIHFIRRRPEGFWIFVILFLGPIGSLIYLFIEAIPDLGLLRESFQTSIDVAPYRAPPAFLPTVASVLDPSPLTDTRHRSTQSRTTQQPLLGHAYSWRGPRPTRQTPTPLATTWLQRRSTLTSTLGSSLSSAQ